MKLQVVSFETLATEIRVRMVSEVIVIEIRRNSLKQITDDQAFVVAAQIAEQDGA